MASATGQTRALQEWSRPCPNGMECGQKLAKQKAKRQSRRRQLAKEHSPRSERPFEGGRSLAGRGGMTKENVDDRAGPIGLCPPHARRPDRFCDVSRRRLLPGREKCPLAHRVRGQSSIRDGSRRGDASTASRKSLARYFSKLVHCAADYAQSLGFPPHRDFRHAQLLLAGIDPSRCKEEFEFGKTACRCIFAARTNRSTRPAQLSRITGLGGDFLMPWAESFDLSDAFRRRLRRRRRRTR